MPPRLTGPGSRSTAYWAYEPNGDVVVFVHGFNGHPLRSWMDFPARLPSLRPGADLVFYGYDGRYAPVVASALILEQFLGSLMSSPAYVVNSRVQEAFRRPDSFEYRRLLLVAHSLGAVVTRRALLEAARPTPPEWLASTTLLLFAPAHCGSEAPLLIASGLLGLGAIGTAAGSMLRLLFPLAAEVEANSETLQKLREDTAVAIAAGHRHLIAKSVVFGEWDNVVKVGQFLEDAKPKIFLERNHVNVCKPDEFFTDPISLLTTFL